MLEDEAPVLADALPGAQYVNPPAPVATLTPVLLELEAKVPTGAIVHAEAPAKE